ncbi:MAG: trimeric intracellular cation channel family protein [Pseudomonadota bacterium]
MAPYIIYFDLVGVALFAATGALSASRQQLDVMGFLFLATLTGIGGGTLRDLILDVPVFWVVNQTYVLACVATALLVYFTAHLVESRYKILLWLDAVALSVYGVFGAHKGLLITDAPVIAIFMGVVTGTVGGILRDVLTGQPNAVTRKEIYITAALVGAAVYVALVWLGCPNFYAAVAGSIGAFGVRSGALIYGWTLPPYRGRPGRNV